MATIRFGCKNCGSPHVRERDNKLYCTSCGQVFEKNVESVEERDARILYLSRLDNAEKQLTVSPPRFDDAEDYYREFIKQYPSNSDGYWGLVRAKYGIKYEDDVTGRKIPSCYKSSYEDFRADKDFFNALRLAESDMLRSKYMTEAEKIAGVCKEWREEASKYDYDVFISFKATDDVTGKTTSDCEEMKELYTYLLEEGYKVFFSPMSMRRYTGKHYDAYIFNALQKAKVMIVYGSKEEYFKSTWVENEWTRFLRLIDKNEKAKGSCIVAYDGDRVSPKDLPRTLRSIQAIDASKKNRSFYVDITKAIKRAFEDEDEAENASSLRDGKWNIGNLRTGFEDSKSQTLMNFDLLNDTKDDESDLQFIFPKATTYNKPNLSDSIKETTSRDSDFIIEGGELMMYIGSAEKVVVPKNVKKIGAQAFADKSHITSVIIPDGVTHVNSYAFSGCRNLKHISIPDSIEDINIICNAPNIEYNEYEGANYLGNESNPYLVLVEAKDKTASGYTINPRTKIISGFAFEYCDMKYISIPESVIKINSYAFSGCKSLARITIPDNVTEICSGTFRNCERLENINIPEGVISIGHAAFENCVGLYKITIPKSVAYVSNDVFKKCSNLSIYVPKGKNIDRWGKKWNCGRPVYESGTYYILRKKSLFS